ncbi:MAG: hypothetical protein ABII90_06650 [Bacteroidota bacterium]
MLQVYIIYDTENNNYIVQPGKVNKERDEQWIAEGDESTTWGMIQKKLQENPGLRLALNPKGTDLHNLPDIATKKMNEAGGEVIDKSIENVENDEKQVLIAEKQAEVARLTELINAQARKTQLEAEIVALQS